MGNEERLHKLLEKTRSELTMLYEIGNAMRTTLKLDQVLFIILTGVTAHEGLGFNRAMLLLVNEKEGVLEGKLGIGPDSGEEAHQIWTQIESNRMSLEDLINAYGHFKSRNASQLNKLVKATRIPLSEAGGVIAMAALEGMSIEITTPEAQAKCAHDPMMSALKLEQFVAVPMKAKDKVIGIIVADNLITHEPITKDDIRVLTLFANHAGLAIENSQLYEQTLQQANMDSLTRLWNHGHFQQRLAEEIAKAEAGGTALSLLMIDIDNFKLYNDSSGHQRGDEVLKTIARIVKESSRKEDFVARYGGEEFAVILPQMNKRETQLIAERIRQQIERHPFFHKEQQPSHNLTVSIGVASFPEDAVRKDELITRADEALYAAKRAGRNRCVFYTSTN